MSLILNNQVDTIIPSTQTLSVSATGSMVLPKGTTAQRPGTPASGMSRYNTTLNSLEVYNGSNWAIPGQVFVGEQSITSGSTTNIGSLTSNVVNVTGSNTISSFGSSANTTNPIYFVRFTGSPTITYNATSLILPGAQNIISSAGDSAILQYLGSGNWKMIHYQTSAAQGFFNGTSVSSTSNAYEITTTSPGGFQLAVGSFISFFPDAANVPGDAATLNVTGTGAYPLVVFTPGGLSPVPPLALTPFFPTMATFDGTYWIILNVPYYGTLTIVNTNTSVTLANAFETLISSTAVTLTIDATTTLPPFWSVDISAAGGQITITPNAADSINGASVGVSLVIPQGTNGTLTTNGSGNLYFTGNQAHALLSSPAFTGNPTAPTQSAGNNSTRIATTEFVATSFANLNSPAFTGTPTAPTASGGTNTTQIATTAFAMTMQSPAFTGTPTAPTASGGTNTTQIATTAYVQTSGYNSQGVKTVSSSAPSGGANGDIWYRI